MTILERYDRATGGFDRIVAALPRADPAPRSGRADRWPSVSRDCDHRPAGGPRAIGRVACHYRGCIERQQPRRCRPRRTASPARNRAGGGSTGVEPAHWTEQDPLGRVPAPASRHPLPWRNDPSDGENHVTDANGLAVYDGADAAEMFRLYGAEDHAERAERAAAEPVPARARRTGRVRRPRRPA